MHSFLGMVPVLAVSFVSMLHWPQLLALFGIGSDRPDWGTRVKIAYCRLATLLLLAQFAFEWLPYLEELLRDNRCGSPVRARVSHR